MKISWKYAKGAFILIALYFGFSWLLGGDSFWVGLLSILGLGSLSGGEQAWRTIKRKREELEAEMEEVIRYGKEKRTEEDKNIEGYKSRVDELGRVHQQLGITIGRKKEELEEQLEDEKKHIAEHDLSVGDALKTIREELYKDEK